MASLKTAKITIDVSGRSVRIIQTNGSGKIVKAGSAPIREIPGTDHHIVLRDAIKEAAASAHIKGGKCVLLTGGPDIITQQFMLPDMADDALRENILTEITQYLSGDIGKFTIDFRVTGLADKPGEKAAADGKKLGVFAAAFDKIAAESLMRAASKAGFTPERLDIRENARDKLMKLKDKIQGFDPTKSFAVLDVSDYPANIMIFVNGRFYVSRYFEAVLCAESLAGETDEIAAPCIESLSAEIASIIDYIQYRERDSKIEHILVFGNRRNLTAIQEKLADNLDLPVINAGNVFSGISDGKIQSITEFGAEYYLDAYAASLNGKTKLSADLDLRRQKKERKVSGRAVRVMILTLVIACGALAAGVYFPYTKVQALREEDLRLTLELENYTAVDSLAQIAGLEADIEFMTVLSSEFLEFYAASPNASLLLDWIYNGASRDMEIHYVSASKGSISVTGIAASPNTLASYMDHLTSDSGGLFIAASGNYANVDGTNANFHITLIPAKGIQEVE
ncbi:MAG: hypothetical protein FWF33_07970 [Clostridiales bacterium]|nr:hypothetical protein [Clostridiales bacterium]